jgi:uncharacterized protein YukJ
MALEYGVLRGQIDIFKREDDNNSPHLQIKVLDGNGQAWRAAVNVLSGDQSLVIFHRADPLQNHPILAGLPQIAPGFTLLPPAARSVSSALDFFRAPLFDWPTGIAIPQAGPGADDDLQDVLVTYLALLREQQGELFVFGAKFPEPNQPPAPRPIDHEFGTLQGMHDIHMNQGNANPGRFAKDNGVFHDGGLILKFPSRYVGLFLRFQTQWLPTDDATGNRLPEAKPIPAEGVSTNNNGDHPSLVTNPAVYIERALVNLMGNEPGNEVVVLGNTTTAAIDLNGWSIVDKNNKADILAGLVLPGGESRRVVLSGNGAQLSNKGGTITLKNADGAQVHAVSYAKDDADQEDIYIRFNT